MITGDCLCNLKAASELMSKFHASFPLGLAHFKEDSVQEIGSGTHSFKSGLKNRNMTLGEF